jgi:hypothetical protein
MEEASESSEVGATLDRRGSAGVGGGREEGGGGGGMDSDVPDEVTM